MSIEFRSLAVGPLQTNCYLLWDNSTRKSAIIDPGGNRDDIVSIASSLELDVEWILLTHGHFDHTFFAGDLARLYSARIGMHTSDVPMLSDGLGIAAMYYDDMSEYVAFSPTDLLAQGSILQLGESDIRVLHTPGHSQGGLCFVTDAGVFCGDTIFCESIGRTDFPGGSFSDLMHSIKSKILTMDDAVNLYPGHGPSTTVGNERLYNPYIR